MRHPVHRNDDFVGELGMFAFVAQEATAIKTTANRKRRWVSHC
jgi:hypothetical protein